MAVRVGDDHVAALINKVHGGATALSGVFTAAEKEATRAMSPDEVEALRADSVTLPCEGVFILRPSMAPAELLPGLELEGNYIRVDRNMAASVPGVFAAGDCTGQPLQVSKAVGEGQVAGHRAAEYVDTLIQTG